MKVLDSKSSVANNYRGFESHPLRHFTLKINKETVQNLDSLFLRCIKNFSLKIFCIKLLKLIRQNIHNSPNVILRFAVRRNTAITLNGIRSSIVGG